ncbi:MAG: hypothetical protein QXY40_08025 [Candidatus Methanomethylicia archaeon]
MPSNAKLAKKLLVGVLNGCVNYIVYYLIPLAVLKWLVIPQAMGSQIIFSKLINMELLNIWVLIGLILSSIAISILSGNIIGVIIGLSIPIIVIVYLSSLLSFGIVIIEYQEYRINIDIQSILILVVISMTIWLIANAFKYIESL